MNSNILKSVTEIDVSNTQHTNLNLPLFLNLEWFKEFEQYILQDNQQPCVLLNTSKGSHLSYIPFFTSKQQSMFKSKKLMSMTNYYSCIFSAINLGEAEVSIGELVKTHCDFLVGFDEIHLNFIYESEIESYVKAFSDIGLKCFSYTETRNWYHDEIDCFDSFYSNCSKNMRSNTRRAKAKLEKEESFEIIITCEDDLENKLKDYHAVYEESWKHEESHPEFINSIARIAAMQNKLRLGFIYHDGYPVAAQMWFIDDNNAYIFKLAYREKYADRSVGNILTMELCRHTIEKDGVSTIDFLTGNDEYKSKWMTKSRNLCGVKITNPRRIYGLIGTAKENLSEIKQKWKK
tara:strand:- start:13806 stop:14849 length:1044 start_codon:yes stop_codon:yes gene_type:complete